MICVFVPLEVNTPWVVRKESGSVVKTSVRHTFEVDSRSNPVFPDSGILLRLSKELASITPGNTADENRSVVALLCSVLNPREIGKL